jgi:hypothetical protein
MERGEGGGAWEKVSIGLRSRHAYFVLECTRDAMMMKHHHPEQLENDFTQLG